MIRTLRCADITCRSPSNGGSVRFRHQYGWQFKMKVILLEQKKGPSVRGPLSIISRLTPIIAKMTLNLLLPRW